MHKKGIRIRTEGLFVLVLSSVSINAQNLTPYSNDIEWNEGVIIVTGGERLQGLIRYEPNKGIVSFESGAVSKSFVPRNVQQFWFEDALMEKTRKFYSLTVEALEEGAARPYFFEALAEFKKFALLSKKDPLKVEQKHRSGFGDPTLPNLSGDNHVLVTSLEETLWIFGVDGTVEPYLRLTHEEYETWEPFKGTKRNKKKVYERDLLEDYTQPYYEQLKEYAKEKKLSFRKKEELLQILDYYGGLADKR